MAPPYRIIDDAYDERAAGTAGDLVAVGQLGQGDLEAVAAGTGIVEQALFLVEFKVFDFYLVVEGGHRGWGGWVDGGDGSGRGGAVREGGSLDTDGPERDRSAGTASEL